MFWIDILIRNCQQEIFGYKIVKSAWTEHPPIGMPLATDINMCTKIAIALVYMI